MEWWVRVRVMRMRHLFLLSNMDGLSKAFETPAPCVVVYRLDGI